MSARDSKESRRRFIAAIGADAAALLLPFAAPHLLRGQNCAPPGNTSSPSAWPGDCRPIQPRRPASTLTTANIDRLKKAYTAMRALDTSDPADPRGFSRQANIHCFICSQSPSQQVHGTLNFLPWHRAYLYFHERILGNLIGDMTFRLPYWDWENPSHRQLPPAYVTPNNNTNPLFNSTRAMSPTDSLPAGDVNLSASLSASTFSTFSSTLEGGPHGSVHVDVGGDMGFFSSAGRDPIFYAHHSNVDKVWADWIKADPSHTNPTTTTWLNQSYGFYDETKTWRSIRNSKLTDNEGSLRYYYTTRAFDYILISCIRRWIDVPLKFNPTLSAFTHETSVLNTLGRFAARGVVHMVLTAPQLPQDRSAIYSIYLSEREANEDRGEASPGYLGVIPVVLGDREGQHKIPGPPVLALDVSPRVKQLLGRREQNQIYAVQRTPRAPQKRVLRVPLRNVSYRVGESD
jgi:polyphenol oxidase